MFKDKKCHVRSKDNKTFFVSLASTGEWSDGMPFTLSDVFFSYNELVKNNIRNISDFELYKKVLINTIDEDTIRVVFPTESIDNWIFFTNFILPRHRVINISLDEYKELFSFNPTTF
jgi:ABC-type transport system substrate-binding protein